MFRRFREYEKGEFIVVGVDTAAGGGDRVGGHFMSKTKLDIPVVFHSENTITACTPLIHEELEKIYDQTGIKPVVAFERQNGGGFEMDRLAGLNRLGKYTIFDMNQFYKKDSTEPILGWDTNSATRPTILQDLKDAIEHKVPIIYDQATVTELFSFIEVKTTSSWKAQAAPGAHDDLVMSLAITNEICQIVPMRRLEREYIPIDYRPSDSVIGI